MDPQMAEAFRLIPYGIYVLATRRGTDPCAMIVSWVSQVSYSPPLLLVALRRSRYALPLIRETGHFSLSLLRSDQKSWVARFKTPLPRDLFQDFFYETVEKAAPVSRKALASWECRVVSIQEAGDHMLIIGDVQSATAGREGEPLTTAVYGKTYIGQI